MSMPEPIARAEPEPEALAQPEPLAEAQPEPVAVANAERKTIFVIFFVLFIKHVGRDEKFH